MIEIPENPFILVDGSSYLFRAYHALPPLTTSRGNPTGAIYGVVNMLRTLIKDYHPERMVVVFDSKEKNFRHQLFQPYKANRTVMPEDLQSQIEPLYNLIRAMGLPLLVVPGVEADDIIGTLARQAQAQGWFTLISTGDKDFAQLVDAQTFMINTMSQSVLDRAGVIEKFEVPPELMVDYLALIGDSVDNVPGDPNVGPKTAVKWLNMYHSLDAIIQHANDISGKVGENLRASLEILPLYKKLVSIDVNVPLTFAPQDFHKNPADQEKLINLLRELEFKTWLRAVEDVGPKTQAEKARDEKQSEKREQNAIEQHYDLILTEAQFNAWLTELNQAPIFAFDTETNSLDYVSADMVGVSFAIHPGKAAYLPFGHDYEGAPKQLKAKWVFDKLKPLLEDPQRLKIGHHVKFETEILQNQGITFKGAVFDVMLESYLLDSTGSRHDMDTLSEKYLHHRTITFEDVAGKGAKQITFNKVDLEKACAYAAEDADITLRLHQALWPKFDHYPKLKSVFETIEMPLVPVLARMEMGGVLIDAKLLAKQSAFLETRMKVIEKDIYTSAGTEFNINSPKQLQEVLFVRLKLPVLEKTPTKQPSTAEPVLQELAAQFPLPKMILEYRSLAKLKSTYTEKLPTQINPKTGRVHTSYNQAITATGRLSSTDPNLQNIPIRTEEGRKIRTAFIAPTGFKIVSADYSQIELRIMAHMSGDPNLIQAFMQGDDVHKSTAAAIYGVPLKEVTSEQRRNVKSINFGLMYGMSAFGVSRQLGISQSEAEKQMKHYFDCFPGVRNFMDHIRTTAAAQGFVETLMGRRLYLPELKSYNAIRRKAAERAAVNAPMQGTNADIIKLAMIALDRYIIEEKIPARMIMQVHDELVFEVSEKVLHDVMSKIKAIMENIMPLAVPLRVDIGAGNNWDEAHSS